MIPIRFRFLDDGSVEMERSGQKENYFPVNFCVNFLQLSANEQLLRNETFFICPKDQDEEVRTYKPRFETFQTVCSNVKAHSD